MPELRGDLPRAPCSRCCPCVIVSSYQMIVCPCSRLWTSRSISGTVGDGVERADLGAGEEVAPVLAERRRARRVVLDRGGRRDVLPASLSGLLLDRRAARGRLGDAELVQRGVLELVVRALVLDVRDQRRGEQGDHDDTAGAEDRHAATALLALLLAAQLLDLRLALHVLRLGHELAGRVDGTEVSLRSTVAARQDRPDRTPSRGRGRPHGLPWPASAASRTRSPSAVAVTPTRASAATSRPPRVRARRTPRPTPRRARRPRPPGCRARTCPRRAAGSGCGRRVRRRRRGARAPPGRAPRPPAGRRACPGTRSAAPADLVGERRRGDRERVAVAVDAAGVVVEDLDAGRADREVGLARAARPGRRCR